MDGTVIVEYLPKYGRDLCKCGAIVLSKCGIRDPHAFEDQLRFLEKELVRSYSVVIVLEKSGGKVVGFLEARTENISQLYVHVDHQAKASARCWSN